MNAKNTPTSFTAVYKKKDDPGARENFDRVC
jgi:hypothetical protein